MEQATKVRTLAGTIITIGMASALISYYHADLSTALSPLMSNPSRLASVLQISDSARNDGSPAISPTINVTKILDVKQTERQEKREPLIEDTFSLKEGESKVYKYQTMKAESARIVGSAKVQGTGFLKIAENGGMCLSCDIKLIQGYESDRPGSGTPENIKVDFDVFPNSVQTLTVTNLSEVQQDVTLHLDLVYEIVVEKS